MSWMVKTTSLIMVLSGMRREQNFKKLNNNVLRFENKDVFEQLEGVLAEITAQFTTPNPS